MAATTIFAVPATLAQAPLAPGGWVRLTDFQVRQDAAGGLHAAWGADIADRDEERHAYYATRPLGGDWSAPTDITASAVPDVATGIWSIELSLTPAGRPCVFFAGGAPAIGQEAVFRTCLEDGGWEPVAVVVEGGRAVQFMASIVLRDGSEYVEYLNAPASDSGVFALGVDDTLHYAGVPLGGPGVVYRRSSDFGQTWTSEEVLSGDDAGIGAFALVTDAAGAAHVFWSYYEGIRHVIIQPDGTQARHSIPGVGPWAMSAAIAPDGLARLAVARKTGDGEYYVFEVVETARGVWSPERLIEGSADAFSTAITIAPNGQVDIAWSTEGGEVLTTTTGSAAPVEPAASPGDTFGASLLGPSSISYAPVALAGSAAAAASLMVLIPFPAALFNAALERNWDRVSQWLAGREERLGRRASRVAAKRWTGPVWLTVFAVIGALLYSLLQPSYESFVQWAATTAGLLLGLASVALISFGPAMWWGRLRAHAMTLVAIPATALIAVGCVLLSRIADFQPGYIYGLLLGPIFLPPLARRDDGRLTWIGVVLSLGVATLVWTLLPLIRSENSTGPFSTFLDTAIVTIVVGAVEGALFGLLPLRFLPGELVWRWSRVAWGAVFLFSAFAFVHVLLGAGTNYVSQSAYLTSAALFVLFGAVSVLTWYFFSRLERAAAVSAPRSDDLA